MNRSILWILIIGISLYSISCQGEKLKGTPITSSNGVGLEFASKVTITQIGFTPKGAKDTYLFGVFEGANDKSFVDAVPLYMISEELSSGQLKQVSVQITQSFKYVRYVGPKGKASQISEFEVSGFEKEQGESELQGVYQPTKLPLVVVHTKDGKDPVDKENQLEGNILIIKDGKVNAKGTGTIKLRGNSTLNQAKKAYRIKFDEKTQVLGLPATAKKWVLFANGYDRSLLRNFVGYKMSNILGLKWAPACEHVDMMVNGDFVGNYLLCDQIEVNKNRVDITKLKNTDNKEPEITGGYILEIDGYAEKEPAYFKTAGGTLMSIKEPGKDTTPEQKAYIEKKINAVEAELTSGKLDNLDLDSFMKYFILQDFTGSPDSLWSSVYLTKERGDEKIYCGPIWDLDLSMDCFPMRSQTGEKNFGYKTRMSSGNLAKIVSTVLATNLNKFKELWKQVQTKGFNAKELVNFVDEHAKKLDASSKLNAVRWPPSTEKSFMTPVVRQSYEEEITVLKQFLETRMQEFDQIVNAATVESVSKESQNSFGGFGGGQWGGGQWGGGQGGQGGGQWGGGQWGGGQGGQWGGGQGGQWGGF